jgi:hypothetical protein
MMTAAANVKRKSAPRSLTLTARGFSFQRLITITCPRADAGFFQSNPPALRARHDNGVGPLIGGARIVQPGLSTTSNSMVKRSFAERQNLNVRMHTRRFTRLTNAFSKKAENHAHSVALYYNFVRIHKTLRTTPAMAANVTKRLWEIGDIVDVLETLGNFNRMNFRRGLFRLWIAAAGIWVFAAGYTLWPLEMPSERQWPPDVSFCQLAPWQTENQRLPVAVCERRYKELILEEWKRLGIQVSKIIAPPFALLPFIFVGLWVFRGFRTDYGKSK